MTETGRNVFAYQVEGDGGDRVAVSILEPSWVGVHGLAIEAVLGFIEPAATDVSNLTPMNLRENSAFLRVLSRVIYEEAENDPALQMEADVQGDGYVYLLDGRSPDPAGRVGPEDIVGAVKVEAGKLVRGSFQHSPRHRLLTSHGFFRLSSSIEAALDARLRAATSYVWWPVDGRQL